MNPFEGDMRWAPIRAEDAVSAEVGGRGIGSLAPPSGGPPSAVLDRVIVADGFTALGLAQ